MICCRYRKYKVSADTELVVRCEIDGVLKHKGQDELLSVKALNEFDPKLTGQSCISQKFAHVCFCVHSYDWKLSRISTLRSMVY
jgi:hypothetical protein